MRAGKRPRGRPKKEDTIKFWRFCRAGMVMSAYDEARASGRSTASPSTPSSIGPCSRRMFGNAYFRDEVKRTLAIFRPRGSQTILQFKRVTLDEEKVARLRFMLEQLPTVHDEKGQLVPSRSIQNLLKIRTAYTFGYAERPIYPRHNRKIPKH